MEKLIESSLRAVAASVGVKYESLSVKEKDSFARTFGKASAMVSKALKESEHRDLVGDVRSAAHMSRKPHRKELEMGWDEREAELEDEEKYERFGADLEFEDEDEFF